jgi:hypothetical protein
MLEPLEHIYFKKQMPTALLAKHNNTQKPKEGIMPFVNEQVPQDMREKWNIRGNWTIDHERNIALMWYESNRFRYTKGYLFWNGEKLDWTAYMNMYPIGERKDELKVEWKNVEVAIPSHLRSKVKEIYLAMCNGLKVCGAFSESKYIKEVTITLINSLKLENVEEK